MDKPDEPKDNSAKDRFYLDVLMKVTLTGHTLEEVGEFLLELGRGLRGERKNDARIVSELLDSVALLLSWLQLAQVPFPNQGLEDPPLTDDELITLVREWAKKNRMGHKELRAVQVLLDFFNTKVTAAREAEQIEVYPHQEKCPLNATIEVITLSELLARVGQEQESSGVQSPEKVPATDLTAQDKWVHFYKGERYEQENQLTLCGRKAWFCSTTNDCVDVTCPECKKLIDPNTEQKPSVDKT